MQDRDETEHEFPGNTGDWFLELLDVAPEAPTPEAGDAGQATFVIDEEPESTSIATPLEEDEDDARQTTIEIEPSGPSEEAPVRQPVTDERRAGPRLLFRWWMIIVPAIIAAVVVAGALWLPTTSEAEARDEAEDYVLVLDAMRATLPDIQQTLAVATEPASDRIALLPLSAELSTLEAAAGEVAARAARELPETLPLAPRRPLEDLVPTRERMQVLADRGTAIVERISVTISYRTTLDKILQYPSLPVRADPRQVDVIASELADALAASSAAVSELPFEPAFEEHRELTAASVASFDEWRQSYLDALTRDDQAASAALIDDATSLRRELLTAIVPALATIRSEVDAEIIRLNDDVSGAIRAVPVV